MNSKEQRRSPSLAAVINVHDGCIVSTVQTASVLEGHVKKEKIMLMMLMGLMKMDNAMVQGALSIASSASSSFAS